MIHTVENTDPKSKLKRGYNKLFENVTSINVIALAAFFSKRTFWAVRCTKYAARILKCV